MDRRVTSPTWGPLHVNRPLGGRRVETGQYLLFTTFVVVGQHKTMCTIQFLPKFHLLCL